VNLFLSIFGKNPDFYAVFGGLVGEKSHHLITLAEKIVFAVFFD